MWIFLVSPAQRNLLSFASRISVSQIVQCRFYFIYNTEITFYNVLQRVIQKQCSCITEIQFDIKYLLSCKQNSLIALLARPKFSIMISCYICYKIWRQILEGEIKNKYRKKRTLQRQLKKNTDCSANKIGFICGLVLYYKIKDVINKQKAKWNKIYIEKLEKLKSEQQKHGSPKRRIVRNIIHNFSSYKLTPEEEQALLFSLDNHIPVKQNDIKIKKEFESFWKSYNYLDQRKQDELKRIICTGHVKTNRR